MDPKEIKTVRSAVESLEHRELEKSFWQEERPRIPWIVIGSVVFAVGVNCFLRPLHLYSGGFMGFSQLITTLLSRFAGIRLGKVDLAGIIYYLLNIPGLIIASKLMRKRFLIKSVLCVTLITVLLTVVPIPDNPVLDEIVANAILAGIMAGAGVGLILRAGSCDGGMDLIGMIVVQKNGHFSVGKVNIMANAVLYFICLLLFDVPTVIYSLIYSVFCSLISDRVHTQNINVRILIVTKLEDTQPLEIRLMGGMSRGLTRMHATGSFTGEKESVLITVISKYEVPQLLAIVQEYDPAAFLMMDEGVRVEGNFLKKLT